jgi:hypothetical protein
MLPSPGRAVLAISWIGAVAACGSSSNTGLDASLSSSDAASIDQCETDVMFVLDRTLTMARKPDGEYPPNTLEGRAQSKFYHAITAIEAVVQATEDDIALGLALFPRDAPGCVTLPECLEDCENVTNPVCEIGEVAVQPALGNASAIRDYLDPDETSVCFSTPTGEGLLTARDGLLARIEGEGERDQYLVLVTDGADFDVTCPDPVPFELLNQMADEYGIKTFVVGLGEATAEWGTNRAVLNQLACAGRSAANFEVACEMLEGGQGYGAVDPEGERLYHVAQSIDELQSALGEVLSATCSKIVL